MKKVAFMLPAMRMGGAEKIFLNLLKDIPKAYDITVVLNRIEGELLEQLPENVSIYEDRLLDFKEIIKRDVKKLSLRFVLKDIMYFLRVKLGKDSEKNYRYIVSRSPYNGKTFDCAISYVGNVSTQVFSLSDRIKADKKIAWIHGETTELKDISLFEECYNQFDRIFCVSGVTKDSFINKYPSCKEKTSIYYNPIDVDIILNGAKDKTVNTEMSQNDFNIVTVGRLSPEKGCDMIPSIAKNILLKYDNIKWYVVGNGTMYYELQEKINALGLNNTVYLVGNKNNPYPYISQCDVYVQPSYEEGYSTTICEAGILGKAIIGTTTSGGIREQLTHNLSGLIVLPTVEDIGSAILKLYESEELRQTLSENILKCDMIHNDEIQKLISIIDN